MAEKPSPARDEKAALWLEMEEAGPMLLVLLRSLLRKEPVSQEDLAQFSPEMLIKVCKLAAAHDLLHLPGAAFRQSGVSLPEKLSKVLEERELLAVLRHERLDRQLNAIRDLFEKEGIPFLPLKGAVIRPLYPEGWMRTSCDIDILVPKEQLDQAQHLLEEKLEYRAKCARGHHEVSLYSPGGVHLELHFSILKNMEPTDTVLRRVWEYAHPVAPGRMEHKLEGAFFLFHIICHTMHHFVTGGCGIRPLMDWHLLGEGIEVDGAVFQGLLAECGMEKFTETISLLTEKWFGEKILTEEESALLAPVERYILRGGLYGTTEQRSAMNRAKKGRIRHILSRIFWPFRALKEQYPVLEKHPWLYPVCQVRRWIKMLRRGRLKRSLQEAKDTSAVSKEESAEMKELLQSVGLQLP